MAILIRDARVLTLAAAAPPLRGRALGDPGVLPREDVLVDGGVIARLEPVVADPKRRLAPPAGARVIEAGGRVLMPGFIDAHTHALWAGDRLDEFAMRLGWPGSPSRAPDSAPRTEPPGNTAQRAVPPSYLDILKAGGGIMSTVRAVRAASQGQLQDLLRARLAVMLREGTTTVEVKSGYGLTTADELKMLRAIAAVGGEADGAGAPGTGGQATRGTLDRALPAVIPTALIGHAIDPDQPDFIQRTIEETLAAVHAEFPRIAIDAYCESGAWSLDDCRRLFERAISLGHPVRIHADQFNSLGMTRLAVEMGALSVDHLEATTPEDLSLLARSKTFGVMLPCAGFGTDDRYANGRAFVDAGGALAIATNCNPGSAPCSSIPFAIALAVRKLGLTPAEAIAACTVNAASLLGLDDRGVIAPGNRADLVLLRHTDERMLAYEFGGDPVNAVIRAGEVVKGG